MPVINPFGVIAGVVSAGTTKATLGEIVLSNSNGVSFGIDGQTITASVLAINVIRAPKSFSKTPFTRVIVLLIAAKAKAAREAKEKDKKS